MKSHTYDFPWQDAAKYILLPLIPLIAFALLMGIVTTGVISFSLIFLNVGFGARFR